MSEHPEARSSVKAMTQDDIRGSERRIYEPLLKQLAGDVSKTIKDYVYETF